MFYKIKPFCITLSFFIFQAPISPRSSQLPLWNRLFYSNSSVYAILNRHTISEYPWLSWYVLFSEMKQKNVQALWLKVQKEMSRQSNGSPAICLKVKILTLFQKVFLTFSKLSVCIWFMSRFYINC